MDENITVYRAEQGETLEDVAKKTGVSLWTLKRSNPNVKGALSANQPILIIGQKPNQNAKDAQISLKEYDEYGRDVTGRVTGTTAPQAEEPKTNEQPAKQAELETEQLTDEQITQMARKQIDDEYNSRLQQLEAQRKKELTKLNRAAEDEEKAYADKQEQLADQTNSDITDIRQSSIKRGLGQSSIPGVMQDERTIKGRKQLDELKQSYDTAVKRAEQDVLSTKDELAKQQQEVRRSYGQALEKKEEALKSANDAAVERVQAYNEKGGDADTGISLTDKKLSTVSKEQAAGYLKRNGETLSKLWGQQEYERIKRKYS